MKQSRPDFTRRYIAALGRVETIRRARYASIWHMQALMTTAEIEREVILADRVYASAIRRLHAVRRRWRALPVWRRIFA